MKLCCQTKFECEWKYFFLISLYMRNIKSKVYHFSFLISFHVNVIGFSFLLTKEEGCNKRTELYAQMGLFNGAVRKSPTTKIFQHLSLLISKITKVLFGIKNIPLWVHEITNPRLITYYNATTLILTTLLIHTLLLQ